MTAAVKRKLPRQHLYGVEDGKPVVLILPDEVVYKLIRLLRSTAPAVSDLDGAVVDEIRYQIAEQGAS